MTTRANQFFRIKHSESCAEVYVQNSVSNAAAFISYCYLMTKNVIVMFWNCEDKVFLISIHVRRS